MAKNRLVQWAYVFHIKSLKVEFFLQSVTKEQVRDIKHDGIQYKGSSLADSLQHQKEY